MALSETWEDRVNGQDTIMANDVNSIAKAVIDIEDKYVSSVTKHYGANSNMSADDIQDAVALVYINENGVNKELADIFQSGFAYIFTTFYNERSVMSSRCQIAMDYYVADNRMRMAIRNFYDGIWTKWSLLTTTDILSNDIFTVGDDGIELTPIIGHIWFAQKVRLSLGTVGVMMDVKSAGAKGDGATDDSDAIQLAIDNILAIGGGTVFFPTGIYKITKCLYYPSNITLLFAPGATLLRGSASLQYLLANDITESDTGYNGTENVRIIGATFDGNSAFSTTSHNNNRCTLLNTGHAKNISVENCTFKNGNVWHFYEVCASENVKIIDCIFDGSNYGGVTSQQDGYSELIQLDNDYVSGTTSSYGATKNGTSGDLTPCRNIFIKGCKFICNGYTNAIGNHNPQVYDHSDIRISDCLFIGNGGTGGYVDFDSSTIEVDIYNNTFVGNAVRIAASNSKSTVHDNRIEGASTPYTGSLIAYCNLIDGSLDSTSADDAVETIPFSSYGSMRTSDSTYGHATFQSADIKKYRGRIMGELKFTGVTTNTDYGVLPVLVNEAYRPKVTSGLTAEQKKIVGTGYISAGSSTMRITFPTALSNKDITVWFDYAI